MKKISHTARLKKSPKSFRRLTGLEIEKFDELLKELRPRYQRYNRQRLANKKRQHGVGAAMKFTLSLEDRLLMLLVYYRCYVTHAFLGFLFGIDDSNVGRNINPLAELLAGVFCIPEKRLKIEQRRSTKVVL